MACTNATAILLSRTDTLNNTPGVHKNDSAIRIKNPISSIFAQRTILYGRIF